MIVENDAEKRYMDIEQCRGKDAECFLAVRNFDALKQAMCDHLNQRYAVNTSATMPLPCIRLWRLKNGRECEMNGDTDLEDALEDYYGSDWEPQEDDNMPIIVRPQSPITVTRMSDAKPSEESAKSAYTSFRLCICLSFLFLFLFAWLRICKTKPICTAQPYILYTYKNVRCM